MTSSDVGLRFASRIESRINAAFGGSMSPSTWMTAMPAFASSRARAARPCGPSAGQHDEAERTEHDSEHHSPRARACAGTTRNGQTVHLGSRSIGVMELAQFCSTSRVIIVAGKGGVGKTTVTATLAVAAARTGMSVLIVEVEGKSGLAAAFNRPNLGYEESELAAGVRGRTLTPDAALVDWLEGNGLKRISKRLVQTGALDIVATAVPGMKDILVLGKVKSLDVQRTADLIIVDAPAAGHAITFLTSAQGLLDAVSVGSGAQAGHRRGRAAGRPGAVPGAPRDDPRGDPGQRARRHRVRDRGPHRRQPRTGRGERLLRGSRRRTASSGVSSGRRRLTAAASSATPSCSTCSCPTAKPVTSRAAAFRAERAAIQHHQADRLGQRLPLPQIRLAVPLHRRPRPA